MQLSKPTIVEEGVYIEWALNSSLSVRKPDEPWRGA